MASCTKCEKQKDASFFHKDRTKKTGTHSWCKDCRNEARWKRNPVSYKNPRLDPVERFMNKVNKNGANGCWDWMASKFTRTGYGQFKLFGKMRSAHRISYELIKGKIPDGLGLDHLCRNRACVNPDHLEPVTSFVNLMRGISLSSLNAKKTHCKHGHEFTKENTYIGFPKNKFPCRQCRECVRVRARKAWRLKHGRVLEAFRAGSSKKDGGQETVTRK